MKLKVKKLPIIIPLVLVAVVLIAAAVASRLTLDTAKNHTDLGRKHLEDGNYASATTEFLRSLSLDPTSRDARLGLAQAYIESDAEGAADEILKPLLDSGDEEAYRFLAESRQKTDPAGALIAAQLLVSKTDKEEDYALRDKLMNLVMNEAHAYAVGTDQTLAIVDGKVMSCGRNTLGQLGTDIGLGGNDATDTLTDAGFTGVPARVYCAGRTSLVLDAAGALWGAGENRWGQQGISQMSTTPVSGWTKITDDAVAAAGTPGTLYILKSDGTLWYSGQGGIVEPTPVTSFGTVCAIDSSPTRMAVLTADGALYTSSASDPLRFSRTATDVKCFSLNDGGNLFWIAADNTLRGEYGSPSVPSDWVWSGSSPTVAFTVTDIATVGSEILLLDPSGTVHCLSDGNVTTLASQAVSLSQTPAGAVIYYADSTSGLYSPDSSVTPIK